MAGGAAGGMASAGGGTVGAGMAEELVAEEVAASLESAGAGGASCMPLIGHVQFLNVVGQVGGSNGSKALGAFSSGFGWANGNFPAFFPWRRSNTSSEALGHRRQKKPSSSKVERDKEQLMDSNATMTNVTDAECDFNSLAPSFDKVLTCLLILGTVAFLRLVIVKIWSICLPANDVPAAMLFPAWEGPVFLVEYMALCDAVMETISTACAWWVAFGVSVLFFGPIMIMVCAVFVLLPYIKKDADDVYEDREDEISQMTLRQTLAEVMKTKGGILGKMVALNYFWSQRSTKGDWNDDNATIRFWSFLIGDFTARTWMYSLWPLIRRIWMSATINITDGNVNAALSIAMQSLDTVLLFAVTPYNSKSANFVEAIGAFTNLITYLILVVPILGNIELPEWLGDTTTMVLALFSTGFAAVVSMIEPLSLLLKKVGSLLPKLCVVCRPCYEQVSTQFTGMHSGIVAAFTTSQQNVYDEMTAELQESLEQHLALGAAAAAPVLLRRQSHMTKELVQDSLRGLEELEAADESRLKKTDKVLRHWLNQTLAHAWVTWHIHAHAQAQERRLLTKEVFKRFDHKGSGFIRLSDLKMAFKAIGLRLREEELEVICRDYCAPGTDKIDASTFENMVRMCRKLECTGTISKLDQKETLQDARGSGDGVGIQEVVDEHSKSQLEGAQNEAVQAEVVRPDFLPFSGVESVDRSFDTFASGQSEVIVSQSDDFEQRYQLLQKRLRQLRSQTAEHSRAVGMERERARAQANQETNDVVLITRQASPLESEASDVPRKVAGISELWDTIVGSITHLAPRDSDAVDPSRAPRPEAASAELSSEFAQVAPAGMQKSEARALPTFARSTTLRFERARAALSALRVESAMQRAGVKTEGATADLVTARHWPSAPSRRSGEAIEISSPLSLVQMNSSLGSHRPRTEGESEGGREIERERDIV